LVLPFTYRISHERSLLETEAARKSCKTLCSVSRMPLIQTQSQREPHLFGAHCRNHSPEEARALPVRPLSFCVRVPRTGLRDQTGYLSWLHSPCQAQNPTPPAPRESPDPQVPAQSKVLRNIHSMYHPAAVPVCSSAIGQASDGAPCFVKALQSRPDHGQSTKHRKRSRHPICSPPFIHNKTVIDIAHHHLRKKQH
jgi:hypothetical protein